MINVKETAPGCINITCEVSGRPLTRTTQDGMFCDAEVCKCEQESQKFADAVSLFLDLEDYADKAERLRR